MKPYARRIFQNVVAVTLLIGIHSADLSAGGPAGLSSSATSHQFDVLDANDEWVAVRENVLAELFHEPREACSYPGLADDVVGTRIHFVELSAAARRGQMFPVDEFTRSFVVYEPAANPDSCTVDSVAKAGLRAAKEFAGAKGLTLNPRSAPIAQFGDRLSAQECEAINKPGGKSAVTCDSVHRLELDGQPLLIGVLRSAVPQAPDLKRCQFFGHRFGLTLQVNWRDLGKMESDAAPGGFAEHYDCRRQRVEPVRLYAFGGNVVIVVSFRGDNIADRNEYLNLVVMPRK